MNGFSWGYFTQTKQSYFTLTYNCWCDPPCARHWQGNLPKKPRSLKVKFKLGSHPVGASIAFSNLLFLKAVWNWSRDIFSYIYRKISGKMHLIFEGWSWSPQNKQVPGRVDIPYIRRIWKSHGPLRDLFFVWNGSPSVKLLIGALDWCFGIPGAPLSNNPFQKGIPNIQST